VTRRHLLEIYACTGTPTCVGCFGAEEADAPGDGGGGDDAAAPPERPGDRAPAPADETRRLLAATWGAADARDGDRVTLNALAVNLPDGTAATLKIFESDVESADDFVEQLTAQVQGGAIAAEWTYRHQEDDEGGPDDFDRYRLPEFYFVVSAAGLEARSGLLAFRADVEHRLRYPDESPAPDCPYVLILPDGTTRAGRSDADGWVRETQVPPGRYRLAPGH